MKRALFVMLSDFPGGAERVAASLANCLTRQGWEVEWRIMSARTPTSFGAANLSPTINVKIAITKRPIIGLAILPFNILFRSYDFVFTTHIYTNACLALLRRLRLTSAGRLVARESTSFFDRFTGHKRLLGRLLYGLYGAQDLIVTQTDYMANHVAPYLPAKARERIRTLPNPVDLTAIDRGRSKSLTRHVASQLAGREPVLFCGRLIAVKQPLMALDAFSEARLRRPDANLLLVFVGEGPLRPFVEAEVLARGLEMDVLFLGYQANPYAIMAACRYGLLTSLREGFPNVVLEMMASGLRKVVMTPCAGDLNALTGVTVTHSFTSTELATGLIEAIDSGEDQSVTYRAVVAERSVERYLDAVLGEDLSGR